MKRALTIFCSVLFLTSCGNNSDKKETSTNTSDSTKTAETTESTDPDAKKGLDLIAKSDCFTCHKLTETSIGPPYAAVAAKYKTLDKVAMDSMVIQINKGGSGRWGTVPMTPHPNISREDAELMVHYIMSIKK